MNRRILTRHAVLRKISPVSPAPPSPPHSTRLAAARAGDNVFSLMRPPGHHATRARAMGFCYLNNIAIAALEAAATGAKRVAVFDFDVHTRQRHRSHSAQPARRSRFFQSICIRFIRHRRCECRQKLFQLSRRTGRATQNLSPTLARALDDLKKFRPDLVAVSAGFDAYVRDPLGQSVLVVAIFTGSASRCARWACRYSACSKAGIAAICPNSFSPGSKCGGENKIAL